MRLPLGILTLVLVMLRLYAAQVIGFGDSEALYASYALHPQPAYLDHPAFIGILAAIIGGGKAPTPLLAHQITAILSAAVPWIVAGAARAAGASKERALLAALVFAATPEIAIGLYAMTPDLLLAIAWTGSLAFALLGLRAAPSSTRAAACLFAAGLLAGVGTSAKASGALLIVALVAAYASKPARAHAKTVWPWAGVAAGLLVLVPIALYEAKTGFPMARHRFVDSQAGAGPSLRNVAAFFGGQLAYLSPLVVFVAAIVAVRLVRARRADATTRLLFFAFVIPFVPLLAICLWSRIAEPHWIAPALLALPIFAAIDDRAWNRKLVGSTVATALVFVALAHAWVLVPAAARLWPTNVPRRAEIANELYGWPKAIAAVRESALEEQMPGYQRGDVSVVGPHWTVCAQLEAALERELPVGCATSIPDDFDRWYPRDDWKRADTILLVYDDRFAIEPSTFSPIHVVTRSRRVSVTRGGRIVRTFAIVVLSKRASG